MLERISNPRSPLSRLRVGGEAIRITRDTESKRANTFEKFFEHSYPTGEDQYFYGRVPIIQPENPSPLAAMLLDGLGNDTVKLINIVSEHPELAEKSLDGQAILVSTRIDHQRPYGDHTVPGELDGWYIGSVHVTSLTYGSGVAILLQPSQVILRTPFRAEL